MTISSLYNMICSFADHKSIILRRIFHYHSAKACRHPPDYLGVLLQDNKQCQDFKDIAEFLNKKYGYQIIEVTITESYLNMKEALKDHMFIVEQALAAIKENGLDAYCSPIRGGTDGARLTFKGLPCPNLGTGGFNYHGPYEYCSLTMMEKQVQILLYILKSTASK